MEEFFDIINEIKQKLNRIYSKIPETEGCQENLDKCNSYCCKNQTPSIMFCEFINFWWYVLQNWKYKDIISFVQKSVDRYLNADIKNGCILRNEKTYLCDAHEVRFFNCYTYGITPDEEFQARKKHLEEYFRVCKIKKEVKILDQCKLVKTKDDSKLTIQDMNKYFDDLIEVEKFVKSKIPIPQSNNSYLMPHEHIMIYNFTSNMMSNLSIVRTKGTPMEKMIATSYCVDQFKEYLNSILLKDKDNGTKTED